MIKLLAALGAVLILSGCASTQSQEAMEASLDRQQQQIDAILAAIQAQEVRAGLAGQPTCPLAQPCGGSGGVVAAQEKTVLLGAQGQPLYVQPLNPPTIQPVPVPQPVTIQQATVPGGSSLEQIYARLVAAEAELRAGEAARQAINDHEASRLEIMEQLLRTKSLYSGGFERLDPN